MKSIALLSSAALSVILCLGFFLNNSLVNPEPESRGIFSWKSDVFEDEGAELFAFMERHGFNELYQWFSDELTDRQITDFLENAASEEIRIYLLAGDPSWAKDPTAARQIETVEKTARIVGLSPNAAIEGIVFDIEPYLLDEWEENRLDVFQNFLLGMKKAYGKASSHNLEVTVCIPYYYDTELSEGELNALIRTVCDRIAVMNYNKGKEIKSLENEAGYAKTYGKGIINIYEFKAPGKSGVAERNTYHNEGLDAALQNFEELKKAFPGISITMAAHDYQTLRELLKNFG